MKKCWYHTATCFKLNRMKFFLSLNDKLAQKQQQQQQQQQQIAVCSMVLLQEVEGVISCWLQSYFNTVQTVQHLIHSKISGNVTRYNLTEY